MNLLQRLAQAMPVHVQTPPYAEVEKFRQQEAQKNASQVRDQCMAAMAAKAIGRSGIKKRHQHCSFENYITHSEGQQLAYQEVLGWFERFASGSSAGFVFSGTPGTGKNHLACAIGNELLKQNKRVLVITVAELMQKIRDSYRKDADTSETRIIQYLSKLDVLVLDEIGIQHNSTNERVLINRIIDERYTQDLATGVITNLQRDDLIKGLGQASIDRLLENNGAWVVFNWPSYRRRGNQAGGRDGNISQ